VAAIKGREGQNIQNCQAHAKKSHKIQEGDYASFRRGRSHLGDPDWTGDRVSD